MPEALKKRNIFLSLGTRLLINIRDFFYPPLCILCNSPLTIEQPWFCTTCMERLEKNNLERDLCPKCSQDRQKRSCTCDIAWDHYFEMVYSYFEFDDIIQNITHHIKYKGKKSLAFYIGKQFARSVPESFFDSIDCILSVPLHFLRKIKRGYNQADYFARGIIDGSNYNLPLNNNILRRKRNTKTQTKLNKEERLKNLFNAFIINPKERGIIRDKRVILVDDVVTTGATTDMCTQVLLNAGVKSVRVISLARA